MLSLGTRAIRWGRGGHERGTKERTHRSNRTAEGMQRLGIAKEEESGWVGQPRASVKVGGECWRRLWEISVLAVGGRRGARLA